MKRIIQNVFSRFGYKMVKSHDFTKYKKYYRHQNRHINLIKSLNLDCILDVGAHTGGFANEILGMGYLGKIYSYEPVELSYQELQENSKTYDNWVVNRLAIGNKNGEMEINVSDNFVSSSLLEMCAEHLLSAPESKYNRKELVEIKTIETIILGLDINLSKTMLKIDTQGYEMLVLEGAKDKLAEFKAVKLELSTLPLYKSSKFYFQISSYLYDKGFSLCSIENGFYDQNSYKLLQFDGLFLNTRFS